MSSLIRNDEYDFIIDNAYNYYQVGQTENAINYSNLISYAFKLGALYCLNNMFSLTFSSSSDFIVIDEIGSMLNDIFNYIINRVINDAGSKLDETIAYSKYYLYKNIFEALFKDARKIVYEDLIINKKTNYRLTREFVLHIKLNED